MRTKIKNKLLEIDENVFYGLISEQQANKLKEANYIVFGQRSIRKSGTSTNDLNGYWYVAIVREEFIPDETIVEVINKMEEIPGLRLANEEFEYNYILKGNSNIVIEMIVLQFTKMKKGIKSWQ